MVVGAKVVSWGKTISGVKSEGVNSSSKNIIESKNDIKNVIKAGDDKPFNNQLFMLLGKRSRNKEEVTGNNNGQKNFFVIKDETLDSANETSEIPDNINVKYSTDFNILWVHKVISTHYSMQHKKMSRLEKELELKTMLMEKAITEIDRFDIKRKINKIEDEIDDIKNQHSWKKYNEESKEYIESYKEIRPTHKVVRFGKNETGDAEEEDMLNLRLYIIGKYLDVAKKYYPIDVRIETKYNPNCPVCSGDLEELGIESDGVLQCVCGYEQILYSKESIYKDTTRVESNRSDNNYQDRDNFEKAIMKYQGKQENNLPSSMFVDLDKYCRSYGFPTSDEVKNMPLNVDGSRGSWMNPDGTSGRTSREFLFKALKETGYADYYDDERLILYLYWNWPRPNISNLEEKLMDDYDLTQAAYIKIPKTRKSSPNTQYRLFRHLQANGHKCTIDDFRVVKTPDILQEHNNLWKTMCTMTNYPLILSYH